MRHLPRLFVSALTRPSETEKSRCPHEASLDIRSRTRGSLLDSRQSPVPSSQPRSVIIRRRVFNNRQSLLKEFTLVLTVSVNAALSRPAQMNSPHASVDPLLDGVVDLHKVLLSLEKLVLVPIEVVMHSEVIV